MPDAVVVISSHVARGSVGNRAIVFALERMGFEVWALPTVLLPHHPGHGLGERILPPDDQFAKLLQDMVGNGRATSVAGIISGYLASPAQAAAVAGLVRTVKAARTDALYLCDPVIGDGAAGQPGRLYVSEVSAINVRDLLLPLADAATPNAFECAWLSGNDAERPDLARLARQLAPPIVLVTSAPALMRGCHGNLLVEPDATTLIEHSSLPTSVKGTGDLLAALMLARKLRGDDWRKAAERAVSSVFEIIAGTAKAAADELMLPALQNALVEPRATVSVRRIAQNQPDGDA